MVMRARRHVSLTRARSPQLPPALPELFKLCQEGTDLARPFLVCGHAGKSETTQIPGLKYDDKGAGMTRMVCYCDLNPSEVSECIKLILV